MYTRYNTGGAENHVYFLLARDIGRMSFLWIDQTVWLIDFSFVLTILSAVYLVSNLKMRDCEGLISWNTDEKNLQWYFQKCPYFNHGNQKIIITTISFSDPIQVLSLVSMMSFIVEDSIHSHITFSWPVP